MHNHDRQPGRYLFHMYFGASYVITEGWRAFLENEHWYFYFRYVFIVAIIVATVLGNLLSLLQYLGIDSLQFSAGISEVAVDCADGNENMPRDDTGNRSSFS